LKIIKTIKIFTNGLKKKLLIKLFLPAINGNTNIVKTAKNNATTPNSLLGIDLNIAYNGKKYHSGTI